MKAGETPPDTGSGRKAPITPSPEERAKVRNRRGGVPEGEASASWTSRRKAEVLRRAFRRSTPSHLRARNGGEPLKSPAPFRRAETITHILETIE